MGRKDTGLEYLPYKFTAKELDEEIGLYYYGARYLDPRYSMWLSTDPALGAAVGAAVIWKMGGDSNAIKAAAIGGAIGGATAGFAAGHATGKSIENSPKNVSIDKLKPNPHDEFNFSEGNYSHKAMQNARQEILNNGRKLKEPINVLSNNDGEYQFKGSVGIPMNTFPSINTNLWD